MSESVTSPALHCSTEGCERTDLIKSAGLCRRCYQLKRAGRDPAASIRKRQHGGTCTKPGCEEEYACRGLCQRHYDFERRSGEISTDGKPVRTEEETRRLRVAFLWGNIDQRGPDECWPWKRKPMAGGHGQLRWLDGQSTAHRAVYEVTRGSIPVFPGERTDIDHLCHDPKACKLKTACPHRLCCNPAHLKARPASENRRVGDTSRPGNGRASSKCKPGCDCKRHLPQQCEPGCTCQRHQGVTCAVGCTCGRHQSGKGGKTAV